MLPPTLSCDVRASLTPRSPNRRASERWTIVAPTCDLMSSPTIGRPALRKRLFQYSSRARKGEAVHEAAARLQDLLDVPLRPLLGADRQVADDDVGPGLLEDLDDVD